MLAPTQLRPRSGGVASSTPIAVTTRRPLLRYLAGGGLLGAVGDALYQYMPPVHVPISNVQPAAPVDVSAAWDKADQAGVDAGAKALEGAKTQMKEAFGKMKIAPAYAAEIRDRHVNFISGEQQRLTADPAAYNSRSVQMEVEKRAAELLDPNGSRLMANANEYEQKVAERKALEEKTGGQQLDYAALDANGEPQDYTYRQFYDTYTTEENPSILRRFLPMRTDGKGNELGSAPITHQMPQLSHKDSYDELQKLESSVGKDSKAWSSTNFSEQVPASMQQLYQSLGGDAWGVMKTDSKHQRENNIKRIGDIVKRIRAGGAKQLVSAGAYQQLHAEQYQRIAALPDENVGKAMGLEKNALKLSSGENVPLGRSHLETRRLLKEMVQSGTTPKGSPLSEEDRKTLYEKYNLLRRYDLVAADRAVQDNMIERLGITQFSSTSDLTEKSLQTGGQAPPATPGAKDDIYTDITHAINMDLVSPTTQYEAGKDEQGRPVMKEGIGFWSTNLGSSPDFKQLEQNLVLKATPDGGTTNKSLADLSSSGIIYNAHTLTPLTTGSTSNDSSLSGIRVVPGPGQIVYLPRDPSQMRTKRNDIKRDEAELNTARGKLQDYQARQAKGEKFSAADQMQIRNLAMREKQLTDKATQDGMVPMVRLTAITRNDNLATSKAYKQSVGDRFNTDKVLGRGFMYSSSFAGLFRENHGFDKDLTGITGVSSSEAEQYGMTDDLGIDDLVKFDVFVQLPNPHLSGGRESQISNGATYTKVQQAQAKQGMTNIAGKGKNHL